MSCSHKFDFGAICPKCLDKEFNYYSPYSSNANVSQKNFLLKKCSVSIYIDTMDAQQTTKSTMESKDANTPTSPKTFQYTYVQQRRLCTLLETKLNIKFWINRSRDEQEAEKTTPTDTPFYRIGFCLYNGFKLMNILRYHPDKTRVPKGKAFATINMNTFRTTRNSQNLIIFSEDEIQSIQTLLDIQPINPLPEIIG